MQSKHDLVQRLFPNPVPSRVNPHAPLLSDSAITSIQSDPEIKTRLVGQAGSRSRLRAPIETQALRQVLQCLYDVQAGTASS